VEVLEREGEPTSLIAGWEGAGALWLVDAVASGAPPGTVHRFEAGAAPLPAELVGGSTHLLGLGEALELARALGRLPSRTVVYGIEGERFDAGEALTEAVARAVDQVADAIAAEVGCGPR
jgi:hydrogenase maturation protease